MASDQQNGGLKADLVIDRDTAARLGITPQTIDDTLYDAFGQRQVSTIFTQLNQYHVVLEVGQQFQNDPDRPDKYLCEVGDRDSRCRLATFSHFVTTTGAAGDQSPGTISGGDDFVQPGAGRVTGRGDEGNRRRQSRRSACRQASMPASRARRRRSRIRWRTEPWLILAAMITVYIVLGVLYESYIHPITILSTLPSAGVGAILALMLYRNDLSVIALIGIILLIGIVKKNAIMMIDFALEAEREEGKPPEEAIYQACLLRFRPIMMTTMAALLGGVRWRSERGTGSELRQPLGITIVGGLMVSQLLTLYTTPVIYLWFDRLASKFTRFQLGNEIVPEKNRQGLTDEYFRAVHPPPRCHLAADDGRLDGGNPGVYAAAGSAYSAG